MPQVVTCILEHDGKILLLKRSNLVGTYRGLWGGIAGYIENLEEPYDTAVKEIQEEVGISLDTLVFVRKGDSIEFSNTYNGRRYDWIVYPFLFHIKLKEIVRLDWEHEDYQWIYPSEVKKFNIVPRLDELVTQLFSTGDIN